MHVHEELTTISLPLRVGTFNSEMNLSLILDREEGPTLVDTGLPGQEELLRAALTQEGFEARMVRRIVLTHQDLDHIGSLAAMKQLTGARTLAHRDEAPYIDGRLRPVKWPSPEKLEEMPERKALIEACVPTSIDEELSDGQVIPIAGGVRVVATPGHTPGHMSLYLERSKTLIAGDALTSADGRLNGPNPGATPDMEVAMRSVVKLAELEIATIVCYHGGVVTDDAQGQLARVAAG